MNYLFPQRASQTCARLGRAALCGALLFVASCGTPMRGAPSLTLLSRDINASSPSVEVVGERDAASERTMNLLLFFFGQSVPTHEGAVSRFLEKHDADMIVDAQLTTSSYGIPLLFMVTKFEVTGRPARFANGGGQ